MSSHALRFLPGIAAGVGLGAFVDGIVFHQILQWHHFISDDTSMTTLDGLQANTLADGLFHAFSWTVTAAGVYLLWKAGRCRAMPPLNVLLGAMLVGWGAFSFGDGVLLHFVAGLHHLHQGSFETGSDVLYLVGSAAIVLIGLSVAGRDPERAAPPARPRVR